MNLNFRHNENYLKNLFEKATGREISLTLTDNSTSMLSVKSKGETLYVRLNRIFLEAGTEVVGEVAEFIKKRRGKTPLISGFIRERREHLKKKAPRRLNLCTSGKYYDLLNIFESINRAYFEGFVSATITWGKERPRYAVRKRTLGSYSSHINAIRINPVLDNPRVPGFYIEFIVYHEMLHAYIGVKNKNGRRSAHSKEFREGEKVFKDYEKAVAWEKINRI
ncbi:MAG: SprT-like domain-containing protein [Deltaproteobacteria bacterium]|nr:SprT-like domain-containing protein [Deltaproteobacteria bacterium]